MDELKSGNVFKHYKGGEYKIVTIAYNGNRAFGGSVVVYQSLCQPYEIFYRDLDDFLGIVDSGVKRFEFLYESKKIKVNKNLQIVIDPVYTKELGVDLNEDFEIEFVYNSIFLKKV